MRNTMSTPTSSYDPRVVRVGAFTMIELLIVIAIIAILSGVLFPVFAQAKVAACRTVSLSNLKQITLGSLMYATDNDDGLPIYASGDATQLENATVRVDTWVWQTQPYIRNLGILVDPLMGDPNGVFGGRGPNSTYQNQNQYPDYGINYVFLSPWMRDPMSGACSQSGSVTDAGATHPSTTIFYMTTCQPNENAANYPTGGSSDSGDFAVTAPGMYSVLNQSSSYCVTPGMDWSEHPVGFNSGQPFTAEAMEWYDGGGVCAMLDGHALYLKADAQAAGTNWATSAYGHAQITHASQYLWDYNGSFFGATPPE